MTTSAVPARRHIVFSRANYARRRAGNGIMLALTGLMAALALVPLVWIIVYVVIRGGSMLSLSFFTQAPRPLGVAGGGVFHAIQGTIILTVLAGVIAIPPGVLAAVYAARNPNTPAGVAVRFATDVLSGVPSIVVGLFGYALIVKAQGHYSAVAGAIALAILMLPIIVRTTEEMVKLVPHTLREGSLALGAAEWKTTLSVVLPAAANGIITGLLLGLARASGETAPLLFTALGNERYDAFRIIKLGVQTHQSLPSILNTLVEQPIDSLPLTLWKYAQQPYPERIEQAWGVALVLMALVLLTNIVARLWVQARTSRLQG
jgi:phosphate transport system permease protein